ncbi:hypothetical protein IAT38_005495 [Cryptococcus sp. DSM 104549]
MTLSIPKKPVEILTPFPRPDPTPEGVKLIKQICRKAVESDEVYSVTYSKLFCPEGKNHLFTLKPYYWETQPGGSWERRDGTRNPYCDLPQGQKQLELVSVTLHNLALGIQHAPEYRDRCIKRMEKVLNVFFVDPETRMIPEVWYAQCQPGDKPLKGNYAFEIALRYIILVDQAIRIAAPFINKNLVQTIQGWIKTQAEWMDSSDQGKAARKYEDNKALWYHAIYASHLSVNNPSEGSSYATNFFRDWSSAHPTPEQYFAHELERTRPRHYTLFALESLFILAELTLSQQRQVTPEVGRYLRVLLDFAKAVKPGKLEETLEAEERYRPQWAWYERMLAGWTGKGDRGGEAPDGRGWEGGEWTQRMRMIWGFV